MYTILITTENGTIAILGFTTRILAEMYAQEKKLTHYTIKKEK